MGREVILKRSHVARSVKAKKRYRPTWLVKSFRSDRKLESYLNLITGQQRLLHWFHKQVNGQRNPQYTWLNFLVITSDTCYPLGPSSHCYGPSRFFLFQCSRPITFLLINTIKRERVLKNLIIQSCWTYSLET